MRRATLTGLVGVGIGVVLLAGCATHTRKMADLRPRLAAGEYEAALALVDDRMGGKDALLAGLERGLVLHQAGRWAESNAAFAEAERLADELYGTSISESALALFTNDMAGSYQARPFEMAMVPYYRALNYLHLGERDAALVEARKTSLLLSAYVDATIGAIERGDTDALARTRDDPFMLYFSGMLYDWDGELNDAFIAYRNAAVAYQDVAGLLGLQIPPWLAQDLERVARRLGFDEELAQVRANCPDVFAASASAPPAGRVREGLGELVLLVENGWVGAKGETKLSLPILETDDYQSDERWAWAITDRARRRVRPRGDQKVAYWLTVALPTPPVSSTPERRVVLRDADGRPVRSVRAHHPSALARITAEAEAGMVLFRSVMRALVKYLGYRAANEQGKGFGLLMNIVNVASETADTRSWLTLPDEVQLLRASLPPGTHDLEVEVRDGQDRTVGSLPLTGIPIRAGDWTFVNRRLYGD